MNQYFYVMSGSNGKSKIGVTESPFARMSQHERKYQIEMNLHCLWDLENPLDFEKLVKNKANKDSKKYNEWFDVRPGFLIDFVEKLALENGHSLTRMPLSSPERGRVSPVRTSVNENEMAKIDSWAGTVGIARHGRATAVRLAVMMVADKGLVPTKEEVEASLPRKLEKGEKRKTD